MKQVTKNAIVGISLIFLTIIGSIFIMTGINIISENILTEHKITHINGKWDVSGTTNPNDPIEVILVVTDELKSA